MPLSYLAYQALWDPKIFFLPISLNGDWALHPVQEILRFQGKPVSRDVAFRIEFDLANLGPQRQLVVTSFTQMEVRLNGRLIYKTLVGRNWKKAQRIDMSPALAPSQNQLEIRVHNDESVPALLVENPGSLRTPGRWKAALGPDYADYQDIVSPLQNGPPRPLDSALQPDPGPFYSLSPHWLRWLVLTSLILVGVSGLQLIPGLWKRPPPKTLGDLHWQLPLHTAIPGVILGAALGLNIYNAIHYPYNLSLLDADGHLEYIKYIAQNWKLPHANQGFEMYHPPLYYLGAAVVYSLAGKSVKAIQIFGAVIAWGLQVVTWLGVRRMFAGSRRAQCLAVLFSAFVPMALYMSPLISNEAFSATVIAAGLLGLLWLADEDTGTWRHALVGALVGLGLLAKYTGLFAFLSGGLFLVLAAFRRNRRRDWVNLAVYATTALSICGWFYAGHIREFRDPFVLNWNEATGLPRWHQNPGYRSAGFYFQFGKVFFHHPEHGPWISWADGNYASMWAEVYHSFLIVRDPKIYLWVSIQLMMGIIPTLAVLLGLLATLQSVWREPAGNIDLVFLSCSIWVWESLIAFTLQLPYGSTIKAFFFLSLLPVLAIYLIRGRAIFARQSRLLPIALDIDLFLLACLSVSLYHFKG
jgi:4-amino-4-deoxy-L-arabinose transferase-like glycosyltransferase